jgi:hypothetical protein
VEYTKLKEPAAHNFSNQNLVMAVVRVAAKLHSSRPMDVMNL